MLQGEDRVQVLPSDRDKRGPALAGFDTELEVELDDILHPEKLISRVRCGNLSQP